MWSLGSCPDILPLCASLLACVRDWRHEPAPSAQAGDPLPPSG